MKFYSCIVLCILVSWTMNAQTTIRIASDSPELMKIVSPLLFSEFSAKPGYHLLLTSESEEKIDHLLKTKDFSLLITRRDPTLSISGLQKESLAVCGLLFALGNANSLKNMPTSEVLEILCGSITAWNSAHPAETPIHLFSPENSLPGAEQIARRVHALSASPEKAEPCRLRTIHAVNAESSDNLLAQDPYAFLILPLTALTPRKFRFLSVQGIAPTAATVASGEYPFLQVYTMVWNPAQVPGELMTYLRGRKFAASLYQNHFLPLIQQKKEFK